MTGAGNPSGMDIRGSARGYIYALVGANLAIVAVASLFLYLHERADNARWKIVTDYHMGATVQARLALTETKLLRQSLTAFERYTATSEPGPATPGDTENLRLETSQRLHTIRLASQAIEALQNRFADPRFAEATAWAVDGVSHLASLFSGETWNENLASGVIVAAARNLESRFEQFAQLHLVAHNELAEDEHTDQKIGIRYLLFLFVALIAGGGVVSVIIIRRVEAATLAHGEAVAALHESDALFKATFDQAAVGIALVTPEGHLARVNEKLPQILGLTADELVGRSFKEITHPDDQEIGIEQNRQLSTGEISTLSTEKRYIRKDGKSTWANLSLSVVRDKSGAPQYLIAVIQDIDARKQAEEELSQLTAELEDRVEERTAELRAAQEELVRSERLAALGQLTATVSHELRNPLGAMRTSVYIVEQVADMRDTRLARSLDRINRSITRCDNIIDELLDFTRIRSLEPADTRIDQWLTTVLDEQPAPADITVKRKLGAADATVSVDANRLRRAIINVYENACQAATGPDGRRPAGRKHRVTVETRTRKDRLEIVIADNGQGILPEILPKIFDPLFSTKNFGVGLGLPMVKQILEQHGGGVEVTSKPGKGTRFVLWVPLAPDLETVE